MAASQCPTTTSQVSTASTSLTTTTTLTPANIPTTNSANETQGQLKPGYFEGVTYPKFSVLCASQLIFLRPNFFV